MNVYDFDGTIYNGDSSIDFYIYALTHQPQLMFYVPKQILGFILYALKRIDKTRLKEYFFCFLKGIDTEKLVDSFWQRNKNNVFSWYLNQQKDDDIVISASPKFLVEPICKSLGINCIIASEVNQETGMFISENCRGQEKVKRLEKEYNIHHIDNFYSDSFSDMPLMEIADHAFIVKEGIVSEYKNPNPHK